MKHAYLIMAHNEIDILKLLVQKIDHVDNDIYIHFDKKFKINKTEVEKIAEYSKVIFIKPISVQWAAYSQIECEIKLLENAVEKQYDYYHLITGVDLPIKPIEEINLFFEKHNNCEFISFDKIANESRNFSARYNKWYFRKIYHGKNAVKKITYSVLNVFLAILEKVFNKLFFNRAKGLKKHIVMKGSAYFDITHGLAEYILSQKHFIKKNFRFTLCCDEVFLHTIAYNSKFKDKISEIRTRYADWSDHGNNPHILKEKHYDDIMNSHCLFARKFSREESALLIKQIYETDVL